MQSHASRHFVSEHLRDRHPDYSPPFRQDVDHKEIAVAYNRRCIPKLIAVLALTDLETSELVRCINVFASLMPTQEIKTKAIALGATPHLVRHIASDIDEVVATACKALTQIVMLKDGRDAAVQAGAIEAVARVILRASLPATRCLLEIAKTLQGAYAILGASMNVLRGLSDACTALREQDGKWGCIENIMMTLAMVTRCDAGIEAALEVRIPELVVDFADAACGDQWAGKPGQAMRSACAECLVQLSHQEKGKPAVREAGGIATLAKLLDVKDHETVFKAVQALMGVTIEIESKVPVLEAAGPRLVELLKGVPGMAIEMQHNCRAVLLNAAEHPEAQKLISMHLPTGEQQVFLGPLPMLPFDYRNAVQIPAVKGR